MHRTIKILFIALAAVLCIGAPAAADGRSAERDEIGIGLFYGTFDESPNLQLLVGGRAEAFCAANPDDPFNAEPGRAPARIAVGRNGTVDIRVNDSSQPAHLYEVGAEGGPIWIGQVCADLAAGRPAPEPFASGEVRLKVKNRIVSNDLIFIKNSVRGRVIGVDGSAYRVSAAADLVIENGMPVGNPADFVSLDVKPLR